MIVIEKEILRALDQAIDANPTAVTPEELRLYRALLTKYVSEVSRKAVRRVPSTAEAFTTKPCLA